MINTINFRTKVNATCTAKAPNIAHLRLFTSVDYNKKEAKLFTAK